MNFILPSNSASLRNIIPAQESLFEEGFLTHELTWALLRIFEKEVENNRKIKASLKQLRARYDFNLDDAFFTIDLQNLGYLDADAIYNFFIKNKLKITDNEILYLFRKFDKDQDGKISRKEFENEMNMLGINKINTRNQFSGSKFKSPNKSSLAGSSGYNKNFSSKKKESPVRSKGEMKYLENSVNSIKDSLKKSRKNEEEFKQYERSPESPERVSVSRRRLYKNYEFNQQDSDEKLNRESPLREIEQKIHLQESLNNQNTINTSFNNTSSRNPLLTGDFGSNRKNRDYLLSSIEKNAKFDGTFGSNEKRVFSAFPEKNSSSRIFESSSQKKKRLTSLSSFDEKELVRTLKLQIDLDREIESTKNELALQTDFNLLQAFKRFDSKGTGSLGMQELSRAFSKLDLHLSEDEVYVLMKRYDKSQENRVRYSDFCDIFTPRSEEFHHVLASRSPRRESEVRCFLWIGFF